jgi:hypothetical protein
MNREFIFTHTKAVKENQCKSPKLEDIIERVSKMKKLKSPLKMVTTTRFSDSTDSPNDDFLNKMDLISKRTCRKCLLNN